MRIKQLNRIAQNYDQHAVVYKKMAYQLVMYLQSQFQPPASVIELGCKTGSLTQLLIRFFRPAKYTAVEMGKKMIEQAQEKLKHLAPVDWIVGDIEKVNWVERQTADLVISNGMLHWLHNPLQVLKHCFQTLRSGGCSIHTMLGPDTFQELRAVFHQVQLEMGIPPHLHHHSLRSANEWEALYREAGFKKVTVVEHWYRIEYEDCRRFLQAIKGMGESFSPAKQSLFIAYRVLLKVMQKYNFSYRSKTGVYATFHIIQCTGEKE